MEWTGCILISSYSLWLHLHVELPLHVKFPLHVNRFQIALFRVAPPPHRTVVLLSMVHIGCLWAHLVLYTAEGEFLHQNLNTFKYLPGQTGRAAGRPPGRPAIWPRGPGPPSTRPIGQAQTLENRLETCFCLSISNFSGGAERTKNFPRHVKKQCQREGLICNTMIYFEM